MKKILLIVGFLTTFINAETYDETKVDLYFANGVMMQESEYESKEIWKERVKNILSRYPRLNDRIGKTDLAYNVSEGIISDMWEAFMQKVSLEENYALGWIAFKTMVVAISNRNTIVDYMIQASDIAGDKIHDSTLNEQMEKYQESIKLGHGVVVVAHSQGNLFTLEAFNKLDEWMKPYFHMISVATPAERVANGGKGVTFYNDIIALIPGAMNNNIANPNKYDYIDVARNALGGIIKRELLTDQVTSIQYHDFKYYMGYPIYEKALVEGSTTITRTELRQTNIAKNIILQWMYDEIVAHDTRESQWIYDTNSSNNRVFLKHKFDEDITLNSDIYPFNMEDGKVYMLESYEYIKASNGGKEILDEWEDKKINEVYKLDNPEEEIILSDRFILNDENTTIVDTSDYLMWNNTKLPRLNWTDSYNKCEELQLDSYEKWRLPSFSELKSIIDPISINHVYKEFTELSENPYGYWSSNRTIGYDYNFNRVNKAYVLSYHNTSIYSWDIDKYEMNLICIRNLY